MPGFCEPWPGKVNEIMDGEAPPLVSPALTAMARPRFQFSGRSPAAGPSAGSRSGTGSVLGVEAALVAAQHLLAHGHEHADDGAEHRQAPDATAPAGRGRGSRRRGPSHGARYRAGRDPDLEVRRVGFEPTSPGGQRGLSPPCMPVPAPPQRRRHRSRRARGPDPSRRGADRARWSSTGAGRGGQVGRGPVGVHAWRTGRARRVSSAEHVMALPPGRGHDRGLQVRVRAPPRPCRRPGPRAGLPSSAPRLSRSYWMQHHAPGQQADLHRSARSSAVDTGATVGTHHEGPRGGRVARGTRAPGRWAAPGPPSSGRAPRWRSRLHDLGSRRAGRAARPRSRRRRRRAPPRARRRRSSRQHPRPVAERRPPAEPAASPATARAPAPVARAEVGRCASHDPESMAGHVHFRACHER